MAQHTTRDKLRCRSQCREAGSSLFSTTSTMKAISICLALNDSSAQLLARASACPEACSNKSTSPGHPPPFSLIHLHLPAPLRSPGIARLHRYYEGSDSCAPPIACRASRRSLRLSRSAFRTSRPQPHDVPHTVAFAVTSARQSRPRKIPRLRHTVAGSPTHPAETGSSSYGLSVRLLLLSTPPRGDAVTFDFRRRDRHLAGTYTPPTKRPHGRTTARILRAS
jgi:hypothetical protein